MIGIESLAKISICFTGLLLATVASFAVASTPNSTSRVIDLEKTKEQLENEDLKQKQVLSALYDLNTKIRRSVLDRGQLLREQAQLEKSIFDLQEDIKENALAIQSQRARLAERLRAIYKFGESSMARFLFGNSNPTVLDRNLRILGVVAKQDRESIKNYIYDLKLLNSRKTKLAKRLDLMKANEAKLRARENKLVAEQKMKSKLLEGIKRNKAFAISRMQDLKRQAQALNIEDSSIVDSIYQASFMEMKGQLDLPVNGRLLRGYGLIQGGHDSSNGRSTWTLSHRGLAFDVERAESLRAIFGGVVVYLDQIPGMGRTMILDHGDHYYSVYAGQLLPQVRMGDEIKTAQVIATVESLPQKQDLYFEIRHFSETYDPKDWMKGLNL